jgi:pimeloyl-ACP methyl ester carboxylesterase
LLHYTTYMKHASAPWVTFVHGAGGSSSIWYKQVKAFREGFNVLLVDLRGHGFSKSKTTASGRYTFEEIARDVLEVIDHLRIESAHFVGISLGTIIVRELAELRPDRVRSMIMAGAVMKLNFRGKILMRFGVWVKSLVPYLILYKFFAFIIMPRKTHRESRSLFIREAKKLAQKEFIRWFKLAADVNARLKWFRQKETGIPTMYIMGDQDHMFLPSVRLLVEAHLRSSQLVVVPACGHVVNVEQPGFFNTVAINFIKSLARPHRNPA